MTHLIGACKCVYTSYYIMKYGALRQQLMQLEKIVVCACYAGTRTSSEHRRKLEMIDRYLLEYNDNIIMHGILH